MIGGVYLSHSIDVSRVNCILRGDNLNYQIVAKEGF